MGIFNHNRIWKFTACICLVVIALFAAFLLPGNADASNSMENTYALVITGGSNGGEYVKHFAVRYMSEDGQEHEEYILPHEDGLRNSLKLAEGTIQASERVTILKEMGIADAGVIPETVLALQPGQTDTYFFTPQFEVDELIGVDILFESDLTEVTEWLMQGMRIYKVDRIRGLQMDGYYGNDFSVCFDGKQIAYLQEGELGNTFHIMGSMTYRLSAQSDADMRLVFEEEKLKMDASDQYSVQLTFADVYGAGFERLTQAYDQQATLIETDFGEMLVMQIEYLDIYGDTCRVNVPVIASSFATMLEMGASGEMMISGLAQQGETINFNCYLRQLKSILSVKLYSGTAAQYFTSLPIMGSEGANISAVNVYPSDSVTLYYDESRADAPTFLTQAEPIFSYESLTRQGIALEADSLCTLPPEEELEEEKQDTYMIEFKADDRQIASIPGDIYMQITYRDVLGEEQITEELSVKSLVRDYYGYWPSSTEDFAYSGLLCADEGIRMLLDLKDVDYFTGILLYNVEAYSDFEIKNFAISKVHTLNNRTCTWAEVVGSAAVSNRIFSRDVGADLVFRMEETFLIPRDDIFTMNFVSQSVLDLRPASWEEASASMTFAESSENLGFVNNREHYNVEVRVHGGSAANDLYGDSGSKNRFYFALEFENGRSGYVLANRQLGSDGFRAGYNETFSIYTNRDYGELRSVRIIADDISADSVPSDKLYIDEIRVCRDSGDPIGKEWIVSNVGWVGIEHHDVSAEASNVGQKGRTEGQLSQAYPVTGCANALNFEFYISTGVYPLGEEAPTFKGSIFATLEYFDNDGQRQIEEFDLIHAMYRYANRPEQYAKTADPLKNTKIISDSTMFRENHTDRFILKLSDVARLHKMSLRIVSNDECSLNINDISVSLVTSEGVLRKNNSDEFFRDHKAEYLCADTSRNMPSFELTLPKEEEVLQEIYFTEHNEIKMDAVEHSWVAAVSAEPESKYDEINVFVYPSEKVSGQFELNAKVLYTDYLGRSLENEGLALDKTVDSDGNEMYYIHGLSATGITNLNSLRLSAQSEEAAVANIDRAIVQQVRNGTVIMSYYFDCEQQNALHPFSVTPIADTSVQRNEQNVILMLGNKTKAANIVAEERDMAVSIRYTVANDSRDREYYSEEVYLSELGYWSIDAGSIINLPFKESFVKDITGIAVRATGGLSAQIDMACAANYNISSNTGIKEQIAWFSFANSTFAASNTTVMERTFNMDVQPLVVTFVTGEALESLESGTNDPIEMTLSYADSRGTAKEVTIDDIRDYVISEGEPFATGSTTTIELLLKDPEELRWVELVPYDNDAAYLTGWNLFELQMELGTNGRIQRVNRRVDHYLQEDNAEGYRISLTNVTVSLDVRALTDSGYGVSKQVSSGANSSVSVMGVSGNRVIFENIKLTNTSQGYSYRVERVLDDGTGAELNGLMSAGGTSGTLNIPENETGVQVVYRVTIYSKETPGAKVTVQVLVDPVAPEPTPIPTQELIDEEDDPELPEDDTDLSDVGLELPEDDYDLSDLGQNLPEDDTDLSDLETEPTETEEYKKP